MVEDRTPILIGAGQLTQRDVEPAAAKEPLAMMVETARRAAADAGAEARLLAQVDRVAVVNMLAWHYGNAPRLLAERLEAHPREELYTTVGGNTPQWLVNETAAQIAAGRVRLALLAGAEAVHTLMRARRLGTELHWITNGSGTPTVLGDPRMGTSDQEMNHGLQMPTQIYPLFENALRAHYGLSLAAHRERLGVLCSRFSAVAAQNPYAWFRQERTPAEITTVTPGNRLIAFPYPKYMNAIIDVDQSAAVLMTSVAGARELGIDPSRWVYLTGCGDAHDLWFVSERVNYHSAPAIRLAGQKALAMAGVDIAQIDYFDLYSCFPCAVQIGRDMLGIAADDLRDLTVTGGLPYHGGPGNNYTMHGIATMLRKLRAAPGTKGLVTGLGWYMTKHAVGIYSTETKPGPWIRQEPATYQAEIDRAPHPELVTEPSGRAQIETYTVLYGREGQPTKGIVIGRLADGRRFLANTAEDRAVLEALTAHEAVGTAGVVSSGNGLNRFDPQ
ncbi:MAG TPA: acetyl-CoA acetyltransferase [Candidatus Binatia bacterium]